ncbi:MAG TPA: EthD domain-containing protein [Ramlibacter sp.]|nr:EthD domain-containing protein [Ramlibacter sp.]
MRATDSMVKVIGLLRRKPGMTREQFVDHWVNVHAPMSSDIPVLRRYVLNLVVAEPTRSDVPSMGIEGGVDGIAEIWFDSQEAYFAFRNSDAARRWLADGATFIGASQSFLLREQVVIE